MFYHLFIFWISESLCGRIILYSRKKRNMVGENNSSKPSLMTKRVKVFIPSPLQTGGGMKARGLG